MKEELSKEETKYSELVNILTQLNDSLAVQKSSKVKDVLQRAGCIIIGIMIGFAAAFFLL